MRWFWLFILLLCIVTGGLYAQRVSAERQAQDQLQAQLEAERESATSSRRPRRDRGSSEQPTRETPAVAESEQPTEQQAEPPVASEPEPEPMPGPVVDATQDDGAQAPGFDAGSIMDSMQLLRDELPDEAHARTEKPTTEIQPAQPQASVDAASNPEPTGDIVIDLPAESSEPAGPSYELRADGSFKVLAANLWVQGGGTEAEPYVLSWDVLKSIEKQYNPKNGNDTLPDWLDLLEGKHVTLEGNTLVPVVASTTRELLVMQNPWDGCCIGVPPTPYDAVEISLNHDVDFGNSAVGYGSVQGVFYADPYVVDGWVLGVYIIEDAKYRSGEGVVFPEF